MPTIIDGTPGDDVLIGTSADEVINGYAGNDLLRGGQGVDSFDGGSETGDNALTGYGDRISFYQSGATQGVVADLRTGMITNDGFGNAETMVGIESLGSDTAFIDTFYGNDNRNQLYGNRGDKLYGFGGADEVFLSSAASIVDGGTGIDLLALDTSGGWLMPDSNNDGFAEMAPAATSGWVVNLAAGTIRDGYGNTGNVTGIENIDGSALSDAIIGDGISNTLKGNDGNDALVGGKGDDLLYGGNGDDVLTGSPGRDWFVIETSSGDDRISDFSRSSQDTILFDASSGVTSFSQLVFTQVGSDTLVTWGTSDSLLVEGVKPKQLSASDFQFNPPDPHDFDSFAIGSSVQLTDLGAGDWQYRGTPGADIIVTDPSFDGFVFVFGGAGSDTITASGNDNGFTYVYGGSGDDVIGGRAIHMEGGSGADTITGWTTHTSFVGGYGADTLISQSSNDIFRYYSPLDTGDTITGFVSGDDDIWLQYWDANVGMTFQGLLANPSGLVAGGVGYITTPNGISVLIDSDGIAGADLVINLLGISAITSSDVQLIGP